MIGTTVTDLFIEELNLRGSSDDDFLVFNIIKVLALLGKFLGLGNMLAKAVFCCIISPHLLTKKTLLNNNVPLLTWAAFTVVFNIFCSYPFACAQDLKLHHFFFSRLSEKMW